MLKTINAADIRHLYGGQPSSTPYNPSQEEEGSGSASKIRTPQQAQKPKALELIFAELWEAHGNGLKPVAEYTFFEGRKWRFDWAFVPQMVAVELDGIAKQAGGGRHSKDSDRDKLNNAAAELWIVFRFSRMQLEDQPEYCASLVKKALDR